MKPSQSHDKHTSRSLSISSDSLSLEDSRVKSESQDLQEARPEDGAPPAASKKHYTKPQLSTYGDLRGLTLGGSPGVGESGMPFNFQPLGVENGQ